MIKVLVLEYPMISNTGYWRIYRPLDVMRGLYPGMFSLTFKREKMTYSDIMEHDIIITRRPAATDGATHVQFLRLCREENRPVIFDEDDYVLNCPDTHELWGTYRQKEVRQNYVDALKCASAAWFSTPAFLELIPEGEVVPNAILPEELPNEPAPDAGIFCWRGKSIQSHDLIYGGWDWYEANKHRVKKWLFLGWKPPLRHHTPDPAHPETDNTEFIPEEPNTSRYIQSLRMNKVNVLWKPMMEHPFNTHKSNIAEIEVTMTGGYCITPFAGRGVWQYSSKEILPYRDACDLWAASKQNIIENYNLIKTAQQRAESIARLVPHLIPQDRREEVEV